MGDLSQSGPPSVLVKSDANDWSSQMQMSGQVECKWLVRRSAITHLSQFRRDWCSGSSMSPSRKV